MAKQNEQDRGDAIDFTTPFSGYYHHGGGA
jgi:hypothetical protein